MASIWIGADLELQPDSNTAWILIEHIYGVDKNQKPTHYKRNRYYSDMRQVATAVAQRAGVKLVADGSWSMLDDAVQALAAKLQELTASVTVK